MERWQEVVLHIDGSTAPDQELGHFQVLELDANAPEATPNPQKACFNAK